MTGLMRLVLALCAVSSSLQLVNSEPIGRRSSKDTVTSVHEASNGFVLPSNGPLPKTKELKDKTSANSKGKSHVARGEQDAYDPYSKFTRKGLSSKLSELEEFIRTRSKPVKGSATSTSVANTVAPAATTRRAKRAAKTAVSSSCNKKESTTRPPGDYSTFSVTFTIPDANCGSVIAAPVATTTKPIGCHHTAFDETKTGPDGPTLVHHSPLSCETITMTRPVPCHSQVITSTQSGELTDTVLIYELSAECGGKNHHHQSHTHHTDSHHTHTHSHHAHTHEGHTHTHKDHTHTHHGHTHTHTHAGTTVTHEGHTHTHKGHTHIHHGHTHTHKDHTHTHKGHTHTHTGHTHTHKGHTHTNHGHTHTHCTHSDHTQPPSTGSTSTGSQSSTSQTSHPQATSSRHPGHPEDHAHKTSQGNPETNNNGGNPSKLSTLYTFKSCSMATHTAVQVYTPCMDKGTSTWCPESTAAHADNPTQRPDFRCIIVTRTVSTFSSPTDRIDWNEKRAEKSTERIAISTLTPDGPRTTAKPTGAKRPVGSVQTSKASDSTAYEDPWTRNPIQRTQALPRLINSVNSAGVAIVEETVYVDAATPTLPTRPLRSLESTTPSPPTLLTEPSPSRVAEVSSTQLQQSTMMIKITLNGGIESTPMPAAPKRGKGKMVNIDDPGVEMSTMMIKITLNGSINPTPVHTSPPHTALPKLGKGKVANIDRPSVKHKGFHLKTKVFYGDLKYENLTIQNPTDLKHDSAPLLSSNTASAARFYLDKSTSSLALCCTKSEQTYGLVLVRDRDNDAYGTVHLGREVGTARVGFDGSQRHTEDKREPIVWNNDRFGSWLVCQRPTTGVFELRWWDVVTNRGVDQWACAKVDLLAEEIDGEHEEC